jgi:hypothetical protein
MEIREIRRFVVTKLGCDVTQSECVYSLTYISPLLFCKLPTENAKKKNRAVLFVCIANILKWG